MLGSDYPLFVPKEELGEASPKITNLIAEVLRNEPWRKEISDRVQQRVAFYRVKQSRVRLRKILEEL